MDQSLLNEIQRRRTFAIISHPDAGKTTLTEKLLLYGGAIHLAGAVKAKSSQRHTTSDWMEVERQRGISVSSSVLQFEYQGYKINLLDTPGHKDFSEDTYRTLTAADAAVMLIDAAKGVEPQTRKLFEVCRLRGIPIFTFINKLDRPALDPIDLIDELEKVLGIRSSPMNWPIGMGDRFKGVYDRHSREVFFFNKGKGGNTVTKLEPKRVKSISDPEFLNFIGEADDNLEEKKRLHQEVIEQIELLEIAGDPLDTNRVLSGELTPVFFGSAMNNFGVELFLHHFVKLAPPPAPRHCENDGDIEPSFPAFTGFIFKVQANMDKQHRNRVAFMRVVSGKFERGIDVFHSRLKKKVRISQSFNLFAQEREIVEEAWPGDVVGILDTTGEIRIGDTLCADQLRSFENIFNFPPEHFVSVTITDPGKRKQFNKGISELGEEGVVQVYRIPDLGDKAPILGAVGLLQFEIFQHRMKGEYGVDIRMDGMSVACARWPKGDLKQLASFLRPGEATFVQDRDGNPVLLFTSDWGLRRVVENCKSVEFLANPPHK